MEKDRGENVFLTDRQTMRSLCPSFSPIGPSHFVTPVGPQYMLWLDYLPNIQVISNLIISS